MAASSPPLPTCRHNDYSAGTPRRCTEPPILHGYCKGHCPDHLAKQHFTRTLTNRLVEMVGKLAADYKASGGKRVSENALDQVVLAYENLAEWRRTP